MLSQRYLHKEKRNQWAITFEGIDGFRESSIHTMLCTGNGRIGIRGTISELHPGHSQGIYLAGFYDQLKRPMQNPEEWSPFLKDWSYMELARDQQIETCLVKCPDFLYMKWTIDGEEVCIHAGKLLSLRRTLDLSTGTFTAAMHWVSDKGKEINLIQKRHADMMQTNRVFAEYELELINCFGMVEIVCGISTDTENTTISGIYTDTNKGDDAGYQRLYDVIKKESCAENAVKVVVKGSTDGTNAAFGTMMNMRYAGQSEYSTIHDENRIAVKAQVHVVENTRLCIDRVSVFALEPREINPESSVDAHLLAFSGLDIAQEKAESMVRWRELWDNSDIVIEGDPKSQLGIRFSIYHLLISGSRDDVRVSIGAKGLSGEGYRGMVFWDTDIHMKPFYDYTQPEIARNLALFRYHTLDGAREKAARYGFRGASYPWETGISGYEECERFLKLITHQVHITGDVVYAIQQYIDCTGDMEFYMEHAAEIYIETARFWVSKSVQDGMYVSIPDASGPDELHIESSDNAYVNNLARYNLTLAEQAIAYLQENSAEKWEELKNKTGITHAEIEKIRTYSRMIRTMKRESGIFEQCGGFFALRDEIVDEEGETVPKDTQTVKQADVLMLLYLLPELCTKDELMRNWDYYESRTTHSSSLSYGVHGIIAAELGLSDKAQFYFDKSLEIDLFDEMGDASEGAHMAAYGMSWSTIIHGYAGARPRNGVFTIEPRLPNQWTRLRFSLKWRGAVFTVDIHGDEISVINKPVSGSVLPLMIKGEEYYLKPGETVCI